MRVKRRYSANSACGALKSGIEASKYMDLRNLRSSATDRIIKGTGKS
jgi:hypothetical protein